MQQPLTGPDQAAAVAADIENQAVLRHRRQRDEADELVHELVVVIDHEGVDANVSDLARANGYGSGRKHQRHRRVRATHQTRRGLHILRELAMDTLLAHLLYQRLRVYNLRQQAGVVFLLVGIHQLVCQWLKNLQGIGATSLLFLLPALASALLWPVVLQVLRTLRRHYRVT